ncbi:hypothetical protein Nepgr_026866 [Nepenthes gracilis]|uniref:Uncharacterized protein n=1 Tax=Nepenthes gracilis TaxID=150966 RepID=A0AAD3T7X3_NEPGR|nr:hypothetical protein Nepgr_026866 [Nepenthes gracilis]
MPPTPAAGELEVVDEGDKAKADAEVGESVGTTLEAATEAICTEPTAGFADLLEIVDMPLMGSSKTRVEEPAVVASPPKELGTGNWSSNA